jgi:diphosphoinositol-polyphosphate diphosphatase
MLIFGRQLGYGPAGERLVAGVVALSEDKYYVLLVQSNSGRSWVLPKGGWETDEATAEEAACREAWEEAGARCTVAYDLGVVIDSRKLNGKDKDKEGNSKVKALYHWFEVMVDKLESTWPEVNKRNRTWMTFAQAEQAMADRPELLEALRRSTITRA